MQNFLKKIKNSKHRKFKISKTELEDVLVDPKDKRNKNFSFVYGQELKNRKKPKSLINSAVIVLKKS
jgi:hypothetical protein